MSYTDTRADRPLTRRRYPSSTNNSSSDANNNRSLVPVNPNPPPPLPPTTGQMLQPQYPANLSITGNGTVEMDRYMAYMDLGQLLEHNLEALFPAADELLANHQAVAGQSSSSYRNYLMEIEDGGMIGPNVFYDGRGYFVFQMAPIDMRSQNRSSRGNSRILRNLLLMDSRPNNETNGYQSSARKSTIYHNNFPDYTNMIQNNNVDNFLCNLDTKSSTDLFTTSVLNPSLVNDVHLNPRWLATVPCKYKMDEVFQEYKMKEAEEEMDEDQKTFAKELFFAAMFYMDEE